MSPKFLSLSTRRRITTDSSSYYTEERGGKIVVKDLLTGKEQKDIIHGFPKRKNGRIVFYGRYRLSLLYPYPVSRLTAVAL